MTADPATDDKLYRILRSQEEQAATMAAILQGLNMLPGLIGTLREMLEKILEAAAPKPEDEENSLGKTLIDILAALNEIKERLPATPASEVRG